MILMINNHARIITPNYQELEAVEHNLHNFLVSVLSYTFSRQDHHFNECRDIVGNSTDTIKNINPAL